MALTKAFLRLTVILVFVTHVMASLSGHPELTFAGISLPDTASVHASLKFIKEYLDQPTINHVIRSTVLALLTRSKIVSQDPSSPLAAADAEVITVSGLLHDVSWNVRRESTYQFISQDKRFEVDGANVAREFLSELSNSSTRVTGWDQHRLQLVWDAIALHATASIGQYKQPEVVLTGYGIYVDVIGVSDKPLPGIPQAYMVTQEDYDRVYAAVPALSFTEYIKDIGCWLCIKKPGTTYDNGIGSYGVQWVDGYSLAGHTTADKLIARAEREGIQNYTDKISP